MTNNPKFLLSPEGSSYRTFTAAMAEEKTSTEIVADSDPDAFFFRGLEASGIKLNHSQIQAVRHGDGPALILAGAGSGKTRVLTARAGYLIRVKKVNPKNIMLVTFSKKAAEEMKERISQLPGLSSKVADALTHGTFHSIFWRLLKSRGYNQRVLSSDKRKQLAIKLILKEMKLQEVYEPETLLSLLSSCKNNAQTVEDLPSKTTTEKEIKSVLSQYEQWKEDNNYLDFDDMLLESFHILLSNPELLKSMQNRFRYLLCDEWQDTNQVQYQLIKMIAKPDDNLFVVGDDDQTIYSFNGADQAIIMEFNKQFPTAEVITLDINYRSTSSILGIANQVIEGNVLRNRKTLRAVKTNKKPPAYLRPSTTDEEAKLVIRQMNKLITEDNRSYREIAILHRTISSSRAIVDELVRTRIPFVSYTRGETFYEQAIIKPVIDYLRLSVNPEDMEAIKGISPTLFLNREKVVDHIRAAQYKNRTNNPVELLLSLRGLHDFQKRQLQERIKLIPALKEKEPVEAVRAIRNFYDSYLETNDGQHVTLHKDMILETMAEMESAAKRYESVEDFIQFIDNVIIRNQEMDKMRNNPNADAVSLMTIHRAKGLEFPVVFLIGASENILPHSSSLNAGDRKDMLAGHSGNGKVTAALEEERRLAYVAVTRAEEELYISSPTYYRGEQVDVSRFLMDPFLSENKKGNTGSPSKNGIETLVWQCTQPSCICWMRITSNKEEKSRECPMCKAKMKKTVKLL